MFLLKMCDLLALPLTAFEPAKSRNLPLFQLFHFHEKIRLKISTFILQKLKVKSTTWKNSAVRKV